MTTPRFSKESVCYLKKGDITMRILVLLMVLMGCTQTAPVCKTVFKTTAMTANMIASVLQCEDPAAITADISDQIMALGLCAEIKQQSMSDLVCPTISNLFIEMVSVPKEWKCQKDVAIDALIKTKIYNTCVKIIE